MHIPSDRLRIASPTPDDLRMLDAFVERGVDMVAVSFVRSAHDIRRVGTEPHPRGPLVVAKIETRAAVQNLEGIIQASGAVMVARGDLGAEMPIDEIPHLQKHIIRTCIALGRPAITATQMLESMVHAGTPTRAEVTDVANAVFDGTSVVMLSGETAIGHDPVLVVRTMADIARRADEEFDYDGWAPHITDLVHTEEGDADARVTDTMTMAAWRVAKEMRRRRHPLHVPDGVHRAGHRPVPAQDQDPGLLARRAHRAPAHHELGGPAHAPGAAGEQRVHGPRRRARRPRGRSGPLR